jgi:hypothetical protein
VKLEPKRPPGRPNRKALFFEAEIARLRSEGYPCEAIWEALVEAGLALSLSAVKREVARLHKRAAGVARRSAPAAAFTPLQASAFQTPVASPAGTTSSPSGKDVAAAWMKDHITNPLVRARITDESGSH